MTGYEYRGNTTPAGAPRRPRSGDDIKVGLVRVDSILFHPHNVRRDLGDLRALSESIASFGVMQPVVVERYGQQLRLRAGHRRVAAAKIAKVTRIPAVIHDEALDDENSVQENVMRRQLDTKERLDAIRALLDMGCSRAGVAETFGVSTSTIDNWLNPDKKKPKAGYRPRVTLISLRNWATAWRDELKVREVSATELLDQLLIVADTGAIGKALPEKRDAA